MALFGHFGKSAQNRDFMPKLVKITHFGGFGQSFGSPRLEFGLFAHIKPVNLTLLHPGVYETDVFSTHFGGSDVHDFEGPFKTRVSTH